MASPATKLTENGLAICSGALKASGPSASPQYVGWGTADFATVDTAEYLESATDVHSELAADLSATSGTRATATSSTQVTTTHTNDTYQAVGTISATGSGTVYQGGLFNNSAIRHATSSFILANFGGIAMVSGDSIEFTFKCQFTH